MEKIKLIIAGETYSLTTEDDPAELEKTGEEVNEKIGEYLSYGGRFSVTQCAVLTALEYAEKYKTSESNCENLRTQIHAYIDETARAKADAGILKKEVDRLNKELAAAKAKK